MAKLTFGFFLSFEYLHSLQQVVAASFKLRSSPACCCPLRDSLLQGLPLFPYMKIAVTPLAQHPSAIAQN